VLAPISEVPTWLELPPKITIEPPVDSLAPALPLGELSWEDFERLCLRLARLETEVVGAHLYGTRGQQQEGIDFFARVAGPKPYRVYQCKRVRDFEPAMIRDAVDRFLSGCWADRSAELVLCSSDHITTTQRIEEFERQRDRLSALGVVLRPWTKTELSEALRVTPQLVHDFFGQAWVTRFCGAERAEETCRRVSPIDVVAFRREFHRLYSAVFDDHDPGLTTHQEDKPISLYDRYIQHDVLATEEPANTSVSGEPRSFPDQDVEQEPPSKKSASRRPKEVRLTFGQEVAAGAGLRRVLIGGPGAGKSALLRYVALDILSDSPRDKDIAKKWGERLPVWIPFAAWVERIVKGEPRPAIDTVIEEWLEQWSARSLLPLVKKALDDERLLLLVDGIDEWTSEEAARVALAQLRVFSEYHRVPVLVTGRPQGFSLLASEFPGWRVVHVAPLSRDQQVRFARRWFELREERRLTADDPHDTRLSAVRLRADAAIGEIHRVDGAAELAEVPLLLSVLLLLTIHQVQLPSNRFRAFADLTRHLLITHPQRRLVASEGMSRRHRATLREDDLEVVFAALAYRMQSESPTGLLEDAVARDHLEATLTDEELGLGFTREQASAVAAELVTVGESVSGILVRRAPRVLGFFHRSLQEHLVAKHLARMPEAKRVEIVDRYACDPLWRETILGLGATLGGDALVALVSALQRASSTGDVLGRLHIRELLTEVAVGPGTFPHKLRRDLLLDACATIETGYSILHRRALLRSVIAGLGRQNVRAVVIPRLRTWFPERRWFRSNAVRSAVAVWPDDEAWEVVSAVLRADEDPSNLLAVADATAERWRGDGEALSRLRAIARSPTTPQSRAATLLAWMHGWDADADFESVTAAAGHSLSNETQCVRLLAAVRAGDRSAELRDTLLDLLGPDGVHYAWKPRVVRALIGGWSGDVSLRDRCMSGFERGRRRRGPLPHDDVWTILVHAFPNDDGVAAAIAFELMTPNSPVSDLDWFAIGRNFAGNPLLTKVLEPWLAEHLPTRAWPLIAGATLVGRSQQSRRLLEDGLSKNTVSFWYARALLEGWRDDAAVMDKLVQLGRGENRFASCVAHLLPQIILDNEACYTRLLEFVRDSSVDRLDLVVEGLSRLGRLGGNDEFVSASLRRIADGVDSPSVRRPLVAALSIHAPSAPGVRDLALAELDDDQGAHAAVITGYAADTEVRRRVHEMVRPLGDDLRATIAESLMNSTVIADEVLDLCRDFVQEEDAAIAAPTACALYRALREYGELTAQDVNLLVAELRCYGRRFQERRQAAYAAALVIGRGDIIDSYQETIGEPVALRVELYRKGGDPNRWLIRTLLDHWPELSLRYPGRVLCRFQGRSSKALGDSDLPQSAWAMLAPDVERSAQAEAALKDYLADQSDALLDPALLAYLGRADVELSTLRAHCERAFSTDLNTWGAFERIAVAVDILSRRFDSGAVDEIERIVRDNRGRADGHFLALCRLRPTSGVATDHSKYVLGLTGGRWAPVLFHALCIAEPAEMLFPKCVDYWIRAVPYVAALYEPLRDRLTRDRSALLHFVTELESEPRADVLAAAAAVASAAAPLPPTIRSRLCDALEKEVDGLDPAGFAIEPRSGRPEALAAVLVEVLRTASV
jgi:hypothetical protein